MKLKDLATHLADLPSWITLALEKDELDFATSPYNPQNCEGGEELVKYFDKNLEEAKRWLSKSKDSVLEELWTLRNGEAIYMQSTRLVTIRHSFCQMVHHRAQLGVYLRLLNIPIPGVYGPTNREFNSVSEIIKQQLYYILYMIRLLFFRKYYLFNNLKPISLPCPWNIARLIQKNANCSISWNLSFPPMS